MDILLDSLLLIDILSLFNNVVYTLEFLRLVARGWIPSRRSQILINIIWAAEKLVPTKILSNWTLVLTVEWWSVSQSPSHLKKLLSLQQMLVFHDEISMCVENKLPVIVSVCLFAYVASSAALKYNLFTSAFMFRELLVLLAKAWKQRSWGWLFKVSRTDHPGNFRNWNSNNFL